MYAATARSLRAFIEETACTGMYAVTFLANEYDDKVSVEPIGIHSLY